MKHRYNPLVFVLMFLLLSTVSIAVFYFFPDFVEAHSMNRRRNLDDFLMMFPAGVTFVFLLDSWSKNVVTSGEYVKFNNFRFNSFNKLKTFCITLGYESITCIEAKKLPLIGIYKIIVTSKNYTHSIPVSMFFLKHKQLFYTICTQTKRYNRNALIDSDLQAYIEKCRDRFE